MDTIDLKLTTKFEIPIEKLESLKDKNPWISKYKAYYAIKKYEYSYKFVISFPKFFHNTNSYLITTQKEVDKVLNAFYSYIKEYDIISCNLTRVDYPFTYIMPEKMEFTEYYNLFRFLAQSTLNNDLCKIKNGKYFGSLFNEKKETFIFADAKDVSKGNNKIVIYNQYLCKKEKLEEQDFLQDLSKFPDLKRRMRIEVRLKKNKNIFSDFELAPQPLYIDLRKIKSDSSKYLTENLFDTKSFTYTQKQITDKIFEIYNETKELKTNINWSKFYVNLKAIDMIILDKSAIKNFVEHTKYSKRGKENIIRILRAYVSKSLNITDEFYAILSSISNI